MAARKKSAAKALAADEKPATARPAGNEIGVTGLKHSLGVVDEEILRELQGDRAIRTWKEMRWDPVIHGGLAAIGLQIRQVDWHVDEASKDPQDVANADFLKTCMWDMSADWRDTVAEILSMLWAGWSFHELVYKQRLGLQPTPGKSSDYNDGLIGWRKFPIRSQDTRERWEFDDDGGVQELWQRDPNKYNVYKIPIENGLLFRPNPYKGNPEPEPIIRPAFMPWYAKSNVLRFQLIGAENAMVGKLIGRIPGRDLEEDGDIKRDWTRMVDLSKVNKYNGTVIPSDPWPDAPGLRQYELELLKSEGKHNFDTVQLIDSYNQEIGSSMMTGFFGMTNKGTSGAWSSAVEFSSLLTTTIEAYLSGVKSVINRHAVRRLFAENPTLRIGPAGYPKVASKPLKTVSFADFAKAWKDLAGGGFVFQPTDEDWLRAQIKMPARVEAEA